MSDLLFIEIRRKVMCSIRLHNKHQGCCSIACKYLSVVNGRYCKLFEKSLLLNGAGIELRCKECLEIENK